MSLNATIAQIIQRQPVQAPAPQSVSTTPPKPDFLRDAMYAGQLYDAANSAQFFAHPQPGMRNFETDPFMRPFSHGGFPTMALGFGIEDLLMHMFTRHDPALRKALEALQLGANIHGIAQTNRAK